MSRTALLLIALSTLTAVSVVACDEQDDAVSPRRLTPEPAVSNCPPPPPCECGDTSTGADESTSSPSTGTTGTTGTTG